MWTNTRNAPFVCARCLSRQSKQARRHQSTANPIPSSSPPLPPPPPSSGAARLTTRRLISVHGADTPKFLQGIITNNVRPGSSSGFYAAFLTAQGKVLHDTFVYPTVGSAWHSQQLGNAPEDPGFLVEVDSEQAEALFKHLKRHKLRSKFQLRLLDEDELHVWSLWKEEERWTAHGGQQDSASRGLLGLTDARAPGMGQRVLVPHGRTSEVLQDVEEASLEAYTIRRYLRGVPEGQREMPRDEVLPMNCNVDIMGGIDFKKGCYLGQELTIRTHHTGVVRRRILPIALYERGGAEAVPESLEYDAYSLPIGSTNMAGVDIKKDDSRKRSTGKIIASVGNVGLGMCRLEQMTDLKVTSEPSPFSPEDRFLAQTISGDEVGIKAFVPDWIRGSIREPRQQKRVE